MSLRTVVRFVADISFVFAYLEDSEERRTAQVEPK